MFLSYLDVVTITSGIEKPATARFLHEMVSVLLWAVRKRRDEEPQAPVGGGQRNRRRWCEAGRRTEDCRCCL